MFIRKFFFTLAVATAFTLIAADPVYVKDCSYSASNTNSATMNYVSCYTEICKNEIFTFDGCSCSWDTYFNLYQDGSFIDYSDDSCGTCSKIQYQRVSEGCQTYELRMGCWSANSCSASVSVSKDVSTSASPAIFPTPTPSVTSASPIVSLNFDGSGSVLNFVIAPGDTVVYTATDSPFSITSTEFSVSNAYSHSYTYSAESIYSFYITDSMNRNGNGAVAVRTPAYYNSMNHYYSIHVGQFIRWQWNEFESTPSYPTFFSGPDYYPGFSRYGTNFYDYTFVIPGTYSWYPSSWNYYQVTVADPFESSHRNVKWGTNIVSSSLTISSENLLVFYASDGYKHNVRIVDSHTSNLIWLSSDISLPGDYQTVSLPPGEYSVTCDYHPTISMIISVAGFHDNDDDDDNDADDDDKKKKPLISKSLIRAAELSLFIFGVVGLSDLMFRTFRDNAPKLPKTPVDNVRNHISFHALDGVNERESYIQE